MEKNALFPIENGKVQERFIPNRLCHQFATRFCSNDWFSLRLDGNDCGRLLTR